jgi:hypothetical protein
MNDTFSMTRFRLLVGRQWNENKKFFLLLWGVISLSQLIVSIFEKEYLFIIHFWLFWIGGCVITTTLFSKWTDTGRSSFYLLLPASVAEKFLCGLFYGCFLYVALFCINFLLIRYVLTYLIIMLVPNNLVSYSVFITSAAKEMAANSYTFYLFPLLTCLFAQSVFMITLIRFRKQQVLIYMIIILAILVVFNIMMKQLMSHIVHIPEGTAFTPGLLVPHFNLGFGYSGFTNHKQVDEYFYITGLLRTLNNLVWLVVFAGLYFTAFYKLKEREL